MIELKCVKYTPESENALSFSVSEKGIHGIFCDNVSERTTLTDLLSGAREAVCGSVLVGKEMADIPASEYRAKIGCALADFPFYSDATVEETLDFVGKSKRIDPDKHYRQIKEALSFAGIEKIAKKQIARLSAQNKARLAIAQALLGNPELLIFEEPAALLDENTAKEIRDTIKMLGKMKLVIIVSVDPRALADMCDDVLVVSGGSVIFSGAPADMPIPDPEPMTEIETEIESEKE